MKNTRNVYSVRAEPQPESRTIKFVAATNKVARDRGIVEASAWDTRAFETNAVFLWAHRADSMPLGKVTKIERSADGLIASVEFAGEAERNDLAETAFRMFKSGFLNAVSVGFRVKAERQPTEAERAEGAAWVATEAELLELSAVPVPSDPGALAISRSVSEGTIRSADISFIRSNWSAIEGWEDVAKAAEAALKTETVGGATSVRAPEEEPAPEEPAAEAPTPQGPTEGEIVAIECGNCGQTFGYCPICGDPFDAGGAPAEKSAPAGHTHKRKGITKPAGVTSPQDATNGAGDGAKAPESPEAAWFARLGALLEKEQGK